MVRRFLMVCCVGLLGVAEAATWYVDAANFGKTGLDGSEAKPYGTIQAAVDVAANGDVVKVAEGVYDQGETVETVSGVQMRSRVFIDKKLTVEATGARERTVIQGTRANTETGLGTGAVRCLRFSGEAAVMAGIVVRGFTLRGGRTLSATEISSDSIPNSGGAAIGNWDNTTMACTKATLIDCDVIDCASTRGGAIRYIDAIRCRFLRCFSTNNGAAGRNCSAYNCLFAHNYRVSTNPQAVIEYFHQVVNCTFIDNDLRAVKAMTNGDGKIYNSYVAFNGGDSGSFLSENTNKQPTFIFNCVAPAANVSTSYRNLASDCAWTSSQLQLASPATDDVRPLTSAETTMAIASADNYRTLFPERFAAEADKDLNGAPRFDADGTLRVGACQEAVTPPSGFVYLAGVNIGANPERIVVNAHTSLVVSVKTTLCTYYSTPTWPTTVTVEYILPESDQDHELFGLNYRNSGFNTFLFPRVGENQVVMMPPPSTMSATYLYPHYGERRYVNPTGTDTLDGDQGLSADKPWRTLQYAIDNATSNMVIHAAAGDYAEGGQQPSGDVMNRVSLTKKVRLVADEGPESTRIVGAPDPETATDANAIGCGLNAVRCVRTDAGSYSCVQGFTLFNGHTTTNSNQAAGCGGGYASSAYSTRDSYLVDSVITNCSASRGAALYGGVAARCRIVGNTVESLGNGVIRGTLVSSSLVLDNDSVVYNANFADFGEGTYAVNVTIRTLPGRFSCHNGVNLINSIVDGGDIAKGSSSGYPRMSGVILSTNVVSKADLADLYADPCFVDVLSGDYRVYSYSPAVRTMGTNDYNTSYSAWRYVMGDYEGRPFTWNAAGAPVVGAMQEVVAARALVVEVTGDGATGAAVTPNGVVPLTDDTPITVSAADSVRPCIGIEVDGVFQAGVTGVTIDPTAYGEGESCIVKAIFSKDWYVDAVHGDDNNTGWTTNAAMKTLAGVMAKVAQGDTVHALPGIYNEGTMVQDDVLLTTNSKKWTDEPPIPARVVVQTNVTLVAEGSVDETVIEGTLGTERSDRAASTATYANYQMGTNAVRCVYLNSGSSVKGFTIRNGRVNASQEQDDNGWGAGVRGRDNYTKSEVVDCVISNCASWRGAAGVYTTFRRCRLVQNRTPGNSSCGRYCAYYGCYLAKNQDTAGQYGGLTANTFDFVGNTVASNNYNNATKSKGVRTVASQNNSSTSKFWNNVILQHYNDSYAQATVKNAYYNFIATEANFPELTVGDNNISNLSSAEALVGEDGVPAIGSPLVDAGSFDYTLTNLVGEVDLNGVPRGRNGTRLDIGAFEQPWFARYAKDIGGERLVITAADLAVVENADQKVEIPAGTLSLAWQPVVSGRARSKIGLQVTGTGTLAVYKDGETVATYTKGETDGVFEYAFNGEGGVTYALDFIYTPGENDEGAAILASAHADVGFLLIFR